jgi:hypothetical protein
MHYIATSTIRGRRQTFSKGDAVLPEYFKPGDFEKLLAIGSIKSFVPVKPNAPTPFTGEIRIAFVTGVWKRPEIFEMFAAGIHAIERHVLGRDVRIKVCCIVAGSEGAVSRVMVENHGFVYIETPNEPLAEKMNTTIKAAKSINATHVICLGSDDIITPALFDKYIEFIREGYDFIGALDWYFYDTVSGKSLYWNGYTEPWRKGHTCGAGRCLSANLLDKWNWHVWENKHSRILDNSMQDKLKHTPHSIKTFKLKAFGLIGLDIKSQTNMTPFELWNNCEWISTETLLANFNYINGLCAQ